MVVSIDKFHCTFEIIYMFYISVGSPIDVPYDANPSAETVDIYHTKYINELSLLFDKHKERFNVNTDVNLNIIS